MQIEIIEFYPIEQNDNKQLLTGTMHVYLIDHEIDLRGVYVSKKKDYWQFSLPFRKGIDAETGQEVHYPVFTFRDREKQKALIASIREQGRLFIETKFALTDHSIALPEKREKEMKQGEGSKTCNDAPAIKETMSIAKPESKKPSAVKQWIDPPPRKVALKKNSYAKR